MKRRFIHIDQNQSLSIKEEDVPPLKDDEVLIKVAAAGINRGDLLQRKGLYPPPADASPILGLEVSGEIIKIGPRVSRWKNGDKVCALTHGAGYCDYTSVAASQCLPVPNALSAIEAAALPEAMMTVWHNLYQRCHLQAGESVLIHGGSSGIGTTAIQLARSLGSRVYTTAGSDEKCRHCEQLGAIKAVNYNTENFETILKGLEPNGVDVILDMAGGDFIQKNINLAAEDGRICSIAFVRGIKAEINFAPILFKRLTITASTLRAQSFEQKAGIAKELEQYVWPELEAGNIQPVIDSIYPFGSVGQAHQRMESGEHIGKILLEIS